MLIDENILRKIVRKNLIKEEFDLKKNISSIIPAGNSFEKLKNNLNNIKNNLSDSMFKKVYDASIKDVESSNKFREWVNKNKSQQEISKALKDAGLDGNFDKKITNPNHAKNKFVEAVFSAFGKDYIINAASEKVKDEKDKLSKINTDIISVNKDPYPASPKNGLNEPYLKLIMGKKDEQRLAIAIGTKTGKFYTRVVGSGEKFKEKDLKESMIFESIKLANDISLNDIIKTISKDKVNIEKIKNNLSDDAKTNFDKEIKNIDKEIPPDLIKQYKKDYAAGNFPKEGDFKPLKDLLPSDFLKVMLKSSEGFVPQVYDDHKKRSTKYGKNGEIKRYEDVYGGLGKKGSGNPTIGYGHLIYGGIPFRDERKEWEDYLVDGGKKLSKSEADTLFEKDLIDHSPKGEMYKNNSKGKNLPDDFKLTQNMFDAIIHWTFNAGVINLRKSGIIDALLDNDYKKAAELIRTKYTGGAGNDLTSRREKEAKLFLSGFKQDDS